MNIKHFRDTDTLFIELRPAAVAETRDVDEDTILEIDSTGKICAITIEHASERVEIPYVSYQEI